MTIKEQLTAFANAGLAQRNVQFTKYTKRWEVMARIRDVINRAPEFERAAIRELINYRRGNLKNERKRWKAWKKNRDIRLARKVAARLTHKVEDRTADWTYSTTGYRQAPYRPHV